MSLRKVRNAAEARSCLAAAARSGVARARWAQAHGVDPRSLNAWRLNLERTGAVGAAADVRFVEVVAQLPDRAARYLVRVGDLEIEVDAHFDDDVLRRLIEVVTSC